MSTDLVRQYLTASAFLEACGPALLATRAAAANLPIASSYMLENEPTKFGPPENNIWLSSHIPGPHDEQIVVAFILIGPFPGVLASSHAPDTISDESSKELMQAIIEKIGEINIPTSRLYSVMGPRTFSSAFANAWALAHGLQVKAKPILDARLSVLTRASLRPSSKIEHPEGLEIGKARVNELDTIAQMCMDFSLIGPHPMDLETARKRVVGMQEQGQLTVARIHGGTPQSLVGIFRPTPGVKAVSMVWTLPESRGRGLGEAIVRHACEQALQETGIDTLALFVEPSNHAAVNLYARIGFTPLEESEPWVEWAWEGVTLHQF